MKVLMLNGSPKANGNTALALKELEKVFAAEGIEVETMQLFHEDSSMREDRWRFCYDLWFSYRRNGSWEFDFSEFVVCEY